MPGEVVEATLPLAMSAAALLAGGQLRERRRRAALNRALHELRRPLQALALAASPERIAPVLDAVGELDAVVNRAPRLGRRSSVDLTSVARDSVRRWRRLAGSARIELHPPNAPASVIGDRGALQRALDNLIANALEHGRPPIDVFVVLSGARVRVRVRDSGRGPGEPRVDRAEPEWSRRGPRRRAGGRGAAGNPRRGHGLEIVRSIAGEHDGRFVLRRAPSGTVAVLDLPAAQLPASAA